jgi:hypothetical protein
VAIALFMTVFDLWSPQTTQVTRPTFVDPYVLNGVGGVYLLVLIIKAADTSKMDCDVTMPIFYYNPWHIRMRQ